MTTTIAASTSRLFDTLMETHSLKNDAALARKLQVARGDISKARSDRRPLGAVLILRIHEVLGTPVAEIRELSGVAMVQS